MCTIRKYFCAGSIPFVVKFNYSFLVGMDLGGGAKYTEKRSGRLGGGMGGGGGGGGFP